MKTGLNKAMLTNKNLVEMMAISGLKQFGQTQFLHYFTVVLTVLLTATVSFAQEERRPDQGFQAGNSYSISEIENVNLSNGNLMLNIPLASLPAGRGTSPGYTVALKYNSKLWNSKKEHKNDGLGSDLEGLYYTRELVEQSNQGGWNLDIGGYQLNLINREALEPEAPCRVSVGEEGYRRNGYKFKLELQMPDGSVTEFRPYGFDPAYHDYYNDGYFSLDPFGVRHTYSYSPPNEQNENPSCSSSSVQITTAGINYYTNDGSGLRLFLPYQPGQIFALMRWTLYFPDGRTVEYRPPDDPSISHRMTDRNGNKLFWRGATVSGYEGVKIENEAGHFIFVGENKVIQPGVGGALLEATLHWKSFWVYRKHKATNALNAPTIALYAELFDSVAGIEKITLPSQAGSLEYSFTYNGSDTQPGTGNYTSGWGELKSVTLPSGARADYSYSRDGDPSVELESFDVLENKVGSRVLTYLSQYDGVTEQITETTSYGAGSGVGGICTPDGRCQTQYSAIGGDLNGYAYRTTQTGGSMVEKIWINKRPMGGSVSQKIEPFVKTEFTTVADANGNPALTAIKDYEYDQNGNVLEIREYDWVAHSSVPRSSTGAVNEILPVPRPTGLPDSTVLEGKLKRKTVNTYYYPTPNTLSSVPNSANHHSNPNSPRLRHLIKSTEIQDAGGTPVARTEYYYDNKSLTPLKGNLTETRVWDLTKQATLQSPDAYGYRLDTENSLITTSTYDDFGNTTSTTDVKGVQTTITYGAVNGPNGAVSNLYPTKTETASNYTALKRTSTASYDFYTGLVTLATDVDNNISTGTDYDDLGRPIKVKAAVGTVHEAWTQTFYDNIARRVIVKSDIETKGDGRKVAIQHFDRLGRIRLSRTLENPTTEDPTNEEHGIKVQTRYKFYDPTPGDPNNTGDNNGTYTLVSNPHRSWRASYDANEQTMGWTLSYSTKTGRHSEVTTFEGAELPEAFGGSNTNATGVSKTDVDANVTTVTDASGRKSRSIVNALGQLTRVDEATAMGGTANADLGSVSSPTQPTSYIYDTLGRMVRVTQGSQNRYFLYDNLGRLLRVRQPEQDVNPALDKTDLITNNNQWTAGFVYDLAGNLLRATDANGANIINEYDQINRVTKRCYSKQNVTTAATLCSQLMSDQIDPNTPTVAFKYDELQFGKGRLNEVSNATSTTKTTLLDEIGRVKESQQLTNGQTYTSRYKYNLSGALIEQEYPSTRKVKQDFDSSGDLSKVYGTVNATAAERTYANEFAYTADGKIERLKLGNGLWESAQFNSRLQVTELTLGNFVGDGSLWKVNYQYGELNADGINVEAAKNTGNIAKQTLSFNGLTQPLVQTFRYDSLYRLKEARETAGTAANSPQVWKQTWDYDRFGNRTDFKKFVGTTQITLDNITFPSVNAAKNRFDETQGYTYDKNGNIIIDAEGRQFTFDGDNKQTEVRNAGGILLGKYYYDGEGKRVKKKTYDPNGVEQEEILFVYDGMGKLVAEYSTKPPPQNPTISFTITDQLGSPRVITNSVGEVTSRRDFQPFGEELTNIGGRSTSLKYGLTDSVRQRFTGYQKDEETGLDFAEARMYENRHGRFTAVDPLLASGKSANPQTFNRYVYVMNNPLLFTDPSGLQAGVYKGAVYYKVENGLYSFRSRQFKGYNRFEGKHTVNATDGYRYRVTANRATRLGRWTEANAQSLSPDNPGYVNHALIKSLATESQRKGKIAATAGAIGGGIGACFALCGPAVVLAANSSVGPIVAAGGAGAAGIVASQMSGSGGGSNSPDGTPTPTPTASPTPEPCREACLMDMAIKVNQGGPNTHPLYGIILRTHAVAEDANGQLWVGASSGGFDSEQRQVAEGLGLNFVQTRGDNHAEENLMQQVPNIVRMGTSRAPCPPGPKTHGCAVQLQERGIIVDYHPGRPH